MLQATDYPHKSPNKLYDGYFEVVDAHDTEIAAACGCLVGQSVGRVYRNGDGCIGQLAGSRDEAESFVVSQMAALKVEA